MKRRKVKEQCRKVLREVLGKRYSKHSARYICYIVDDFKYWVARDAYKVLHGRDISVAVPTEYPPMMEI